MRESRTYGSVRGALSNERPYRDRARAVPTISLANEMVGTRRFAHPTASLDASSPREERGEGEEAVGSRTPAAWSRRR